MRSRPINAESTQASVLNYLRESATPAQVERVHKRGIPKWSILGARKSTVQEVARALGKNEYLAEALWVSNFHEARLVAILIADPHKISYLTLKQWSNDLWSWDITDHFARYLLPYVALPERLLADCATSDLIFTKRLAFAGIACLAQKNKKVSEQQFDDYCEYIRQGANDSTHHVRKAVVWALVEIGKVSDSLQESAIVFAADLAEGGGNTGWVGRNAMKELEMLVSVPERRRLISRKSKTGRKKDNVI